MHLGGPQQGHWGSGSCPGGAPQLNTQRRNSLTETRPWTVTRRCFSLSITTSPSSGEKAGEQLHSTANRRRKHSPLRQPSGAFHQQGEGCGAWQADRARLESGAARDGTAAAEGLTVKLKNQQQRDQLCGLEKMPEKKAGRSRLQKGSREGQEGALHGMGSISAWGQAQRKRRAPPPPGQKAGQADGGGDRPTKPEIKESTAGGTNQGGERVGGWGSVKADQGMGFGGGAWSRDILPNAQVMTGRTGFKLLGSLAPGSRCRHQKRGTPF